MGSTLVLRIACVSIWLLTLHCLQPLRLTHRVGGSSVRTCATGFPLSLCLSLTHSLSHSLVLHAFCTHTLSFNFGIFRQHESAVKKKSEQTRFSFLPLINRSFDRSIICHSSSLIGGMRSGDPRARFPSGSGN